MSPTDVERRIAEYDHALATGRADYERMRALMASPGYIERILEAVGRIAEMTDVKGDRADLQALIAIGRIQEIVSQFKDDRAVIDRYERLKESRQKLERP